MWVDGLVNSLVLVRYSVKKINSFENEYNNICCIVSRIIFAIELVKGKDRPCKSSKPVRYEHRSTISLLLRLTKLLHGTDKIVILDSGFCILSGIIKLMKKGVYASALIKK